MPDLDRLVARVAALRATTPSPRVLIGIAGAPGSGKTTLAAALVGRLGPSAAHIPMDGFHLADRALDLLGRRDRKGAPDTFDVAGYAALLARIRSGEDVWAPDFERDLEQPLAQALAVSSEHRVVVSEGNYLLLPDVHWAHVHDQFDEVWFCRTDRSVRRARLLERHVRFGKTPDAAREWIDRVDDPNAVLVDATAHRADLVVDV